MGLGYPSTVNQEKNSIMTQLYVNGYLDSKVWTLDLSDKKNGYIKADNKIDSKNIGTDLDLINFLKVLKKMNRGVNKQL